jgi:hypothetical protein
MLLAMARYFREVRRFVVMARNGTILFVSMVRRCASKDALGSGTVGRSFLGCFLVLVDSVREPLWHAVEGFRSQERGEVVVGEKLPQGARDDQQSLLGAVRS